MSSCTASYQGPKFLFHRVFNSVGGQSITYDICVVVNTFPGGGVALRFGAAGSGQCVRLNGGAKFL